MSSIDKHLEALFVVDTLSYRCTILRETNFLLLNIEPKKNESQLYVISIEVPLMCSYECGALGACPGDDNGYQDGNVGYSNTCVFFQRLC